MISSRHTAWRQRGSALFVGLIMLVLITLFALSSFNMGKSSLEIAGNAQNTNAMVMSANDAIQEAISTTRMFEKPSAVFLAPCGAANTRCFDTNGSGTNDVVVSLTPAPICIQAAAIPLTALNVADTSDQGCIKSVGMNPDGTSSNESICSNSTWNINAVAQDKVTLATASVTEGVTVRIKSNIVDTYCP